MKWYWKILIALCAVALLLLLLNIGLNIWIDRQLPKIINRENDSEYFITYKDLDVSLWDSRIVANSIVVVPKKALKDSLNKAGIYAKIDQVKVTDFDIWEVAFHDKIIAKSMSIEKPDIVLYKKKSRYDVKETVVGPFDKIVSVSDILVRHGNLQIFSGKHKTPFLNVQNINVQLDGVLVSETSLAEVIPFHFRNYALSCESLYFEPNPFYHIRAKKIKSTKTNLRIDRFEMVPQMGRREFVASIPKEKDLNTISCKSIDVGQLDWGFNKKDLFVHSKLVKLDEVSANIYRSKEPQDDLSKKDLYNKLLRELKFDLKVDTLKVRNSIVEYEEEKSFEYGAGKLSFSRFNVLATNICSGFKKTTLPDLKIKVKCLFMKTSPLEVDWTLNVMDKSDGFHIKGTMRHFDSENMVRFTRPYMNVTTTGMIDEVHFDFTGNDSKNSGAFAVKYDDLKFVIYQKDEREKKNKFLTFVAKIFVKKTTKDRIRDTTVEVDRIPEKSFYNFLWRSVAEGLKKILI